MLKKISAFLPLLALIACENSIQVEKGAVSGLVSSDICSGKVVAGITGTANCSGGGGGGSVSVDAGLYVFSSRNDLNSIDMSDPQVLLDLISGSIDRSAGVATLSQVYSSTNFVNFFTARYQVIPNPVGDSDGRFRDNPQSLGRKHYLDRIVGRPDQECGASGTISQRIADCEAENGAKAFYNGAQYGAGGEGDWRLVSRLSTGEEVWRDERTKLVWSDRARGNPDPSLHANDASRPENGGHYNWYQASGYAKDATISQNETGYIADPNDPATDCYNGVGNIACQPSQPISICAEVNGSGEIVGGGADPSYTYQANPETAFKANLGIAQNVLWKLPSRDDFMQAEVNGIRKVLPLMDDMDDDMNFLNTFPNNNGGWYYFWSSSSYSGYRYSAWYFGGSYGDFSVDDRYNGGNFLVRCVGLSRD